MNRNERRLRVLESCARARIPKTRAEREAELPKLDLSSRRREEIVAIFRECRFAEGITADSTDEDVTEALARLRKGEGVTRIFSAMG